MDKSYKELQEEMQGHFRFAVIAWTVALPCMYALLIWLHIKGGLPNGNWYFVALYPAGCAASILGGMWFTMWRSLARARTIVSAQDRMKSSEEVKDSQNMS